MLLDVFRSNVSSVIRDIEPIDVRITVGCLLYSYISNQIDTLNLRDQLTSFKEYYYSECVDRKITNRTIGFINIEKLIKNRKISDFSNLSNSDYEQILKLFENTTLEVKFNPLTLDARMYGKDAFKSSYEKERFNILHSEFLKPIVMYYKNKYNIPYSNLQITEIPDTAIPGRDITFFIKDYLSIRIIQDIEQGLILLDKKPSVVKLTEDSFVHIII